MVWSLRVPSPAVVHPTRVGSSPTRGEAQGPLWRRTSPGLYVPVEADRGVVEQRIVEEAGRLPPGGAVTGWAALRLHGAGYFDGLASDGTTEIPVPLIVPPGANLRPAPGFVRHRERLDAREVVTLLGVRATSAHRATFDATRRARDVRRAVVALDMALASGLVSVPAFRAYLDQTGRRTGSRATRQALELADARSMSPQETALRLIWVLDAGLPAPRCNWPVADARGTFIGRPDLLSEEHAVIGEFDGAQHRSRSRHRDDLRRDDAFRAVGLEPFRIVGADVTDVPLVIARIHAAIERSRASGTPRTWLAQVNPRPV